MPRPTTKEQSTPIGKRLDYIEVPGVRGLLSGHVVDTRVVGWWRWKHVELIVALTDITGRTPCIRVWEGRFCCPYGNHTRHTFKGFFNV